MEAEPAVASVAFASHCPGSGTRERIEVEGSGPPTESTTTGTDAQGASGSAAVINRVDTDLFTVIDVPILAGRGFVEADAGERSTAVIVDRIFVEQVLGGGDALGRRIRYIRETREAATTDIEAGPWLEIVGVVPDFTIRMDGTYPLLNRPSACGTTSVPANGDSTPSLPHGSWQSS